MKRVVKLIRCQWDLHYEKWMHRFVREILKGPSDLVPNSKRLASRFRSLVALKDGLSNCS